MSDRDALLFVPLGGAGEIGCNLYLYGHRGRWLMVDCGIGFGDERVPGIEIIMADPAFIAERRADLAGLVLTHGHEDHLGAIAYLWDQLGCPIYATGFTADLLRPKLRDEGLESEVDLRVVEPGKPFSVGPFGLEFVSMTHSIPEPNLLAIRTKAGLVVHTGDWKLDPDPVIDGLADEAALIRLGKEGVVALVGDSTNIFTEGRSGSESAVRDSLFTLIAAYAGRKLAVTCFATNVGRVDSIARAARAAGRSVALVGRSLWKIDQVGRAHGYFKGLPPFLSDADAARLPPETVLYVCTGSQGESRSALAKMASGDHPNLSLGAGDVVIFSSRIIPGNEKDIFAVQNGLARRGVEVVTEEDHFVHVSGHPAREELKQLYALLKPAQIIPMHGEERHLSAHALYARELGVPHALVVRDGDLARLAPGPAEVIDTVPIGRLALDGTRLIRIDSAVMKSRHRMIWNGTAVVTVVIDAKGRLAADPRVSALGLLDPETDADILADVEAAVAEAVGALPASAKRDDAHLREAARLAVRRAIHDRFDKKPLTDVHLIRL